jgi:hypothetical protein
MHAHSAQHARTHLDTQPAQHLALCGVRVFTQELLHVVLSNLRHLSLASALVFPERSLLTLLLSRTHARTTEEHTARTTTRTAMGNLNNSRSASLAYMSQYRPMASSRVSLPARFGRAAVRQQTQGDV